MRALFTASLLSMIACSGAATPDAGAGGGHIAVGGGEGGGGALVTVGGGSASVGGGNALGGGSPFDAGSGGSSTGGGTTDTDAGTPGLTMAQKAVLTARPYRMVVPAGYQMNTATPFVLLLHGYTATGLTQDMYFKLSQLAQSRTFLLATPDGTVDASGQHFWNATDGCCDLYGTHVDDVFYLTAVMDDVALKYNVDPRRIFVMGHSNGAFMAHRMACDRADRIAGIMALAGDNWLDATKCSPTSHEVAILQVHGTLDAVIPYGGGTQAGQGTFPSAKNSVKSWAEKFGCSTTLTSAGSDLDLEATLLGNETIRQQHAGCSAGAVELWSIQGGSHLPTFGSDWPGKLYDFLMAHPKP